VAASAKDKQRIAIARALLRPGHILLLDEAYFRPRSRNGTATNKKPAQRLRRQNIHLHHTPSGSSRGLRSNYTTLSIHLAFISPSSLTAKDATFCITPRNEPDHIKASNR